MARYVHKTDGAVVGLGWAARQYGFSRLLEPVAPGVMDYCNLAIIEETPVPDGKKRTGMAALSNGKWYETYEDIPPQVRAVSMRQARLALHQMDKLAAVETALNALTEPDKTNALIEWEYSTVVKSDSPWVESIGQALTLDVDALFDLAEQL